MDRLTATAYVVYNTYMNVMTVIQCWPCEGQMSPYCTRADATSINLEFGRSRSCFVGTELAGTRCVTRYWSDEVLVDRLHGPIRQGNALGDTQPACQTKIRPRPRRRSMRFGRGLLVARRDQ